MEFSQDEFDEILGIFSEESDEIVHRIDNNILSLEKDPQNKDILIELFRDAHSLKGAARMIGFNDIQLLAHKIEDILGLAKDGKLLIKEEITDALYKAMDFVNLSIQLSVKAKREVTSEDFKKFITLLEDVVKPHINKQHNIPKVNREPSVISQPKTKTFFNESSEFISLLKNKSKDVNAQIAESFFLLNKINDNPEESCVMALLYNIDLLKNIFETSSSKDITDGLQNILNRLEFYIKEKAPLNYVELEKVQGAFMTVVEKIVALFNAFELEVVDYQKLLEHKLNTDNNSNIGEVKEESGIENTPIELVREILSQDISESALDFVDKNVNSLLVSYKNSPIEVVFKKILSIINLIKENDLHPGKEVLSLFRQNIQLVEKILENTEPITQKDIDLLIQSLEITEQIVGMKNAEEVFGVPAVQPQKNVSLIEQSLNIQGQDVFKIFDSTAIKTLRVNTQKLDKLVNQIGEVIISKIKSQKHILELDEINNRLVDLYEFVLKAQNYMRYYDRKLPQADKKVDVTALASFNKQILSYLDESQVKLNDEIQRVYKLHKRMQEDDAKLNLVVNQLEQMVKNIRLLPLATVFHMIPRMVRDIAKESNKEIDLTISGSETNADKKIIEDIKTPLVHIIRNAIDHGIEPPQERIAMGKEPSGRISLSAKHNANKIIIEVMDDGRGVNLEKIKQKAINKGLLTFEEINAMTNEQIMNLIFWPGFTTEDTVTDISGRGIGLDIVQTKISQLNGKVKVNSFVGKGTKVVIELPVTMATIKSFIIRLNSQSYAIPVSAIKSVIKVRNEDIYQKDGKENIMYNETSVPIYNLSHILGIEDEKPLRSSQTVLLIESENNIIGLIVEELDGDQEILNKELAPPLFKIKNISGITTLVNGDICLIINVSELVKTIVSGDYSNDNPTSNVIDRFDEEYTPSKYRILVVDDFMTTRIMIKNILTARDYKVDMAVSGAEALDMLAHNAYDVIISDIEMPDMNGYELAKNIRSNSDVPIILISSIIENDNSEEIYGCGANMFVNKNQFDQDYFVSSIEHLIKQRLKDSYAE